jgi:arylsulfatase A-like enzyme
VPPAETVPAKLKLSGHYEDAKTSDLAINYDQEHLMHKHIFIHVLLIVMVVILPQLAWPAKPNVLLIMSDDLNCAISGFGHAQCQTPHLDRLAAQGLKLERTYCQYPSCGPSRVSMLTGLYPYTTGVLKNKMDFRDTIPNTVTLPQLFKQNSYDVARISKIYHMDIPGDILAGTAGMDDTQSWNETLNIKAREQHSPGQFEDLAPKRSHQGTDFLRVEAQGNDQTQADGMAADQAIAWLKRDRKNPFFLAVGFVRPHVPLVAPAPYFKSYPVGNMQLPFSPDNDLNDVPRPAQDYLTPADFGMSTSQQQSVLRAYYASVSFMDAQVGRVLAALDELGLRDNTIVVFTSDHGYHLGEHHKWMKMSLFEEATRVPLIISVPWLKQSHGQSTVKIAELIDLYPTIADLAGLKAPDTLHGISLKPLLLNPTTPDWPRKSAFTILESIGESLRTEKWRYTEWQQGKQGIELYDHANDPNEFYNLAHQADYKTIQTELKTQLAAKRQAAGYTAGSIGNAAQFPLQHQGPLTNPYESLVLGNGDLSLSARMLSHEMILNLGKSDVWDSRMNTRAADAAVSHDDLVACNGDDPGLHQRLPYFQNNYLNATQQGPCPKPVGTIRIRHPGLSNTKIHTKLDIAQGILTTVYTFAQGSLHIESFVHRNKNTVLIKLTAQGQIPWLNLILEKTADAVDAEIPDPVITFEPDNVQCAISQTIPGQYGVDDFTWHMGTKFPQALHPDLPFPVRKWRYAIKQDLQLKDGDSVVFAVGVTTDRDTQNNAPSKAMALADTAGGKSFDQEKAAHIEAWRQFWSACAIELQDKELEALWYRCLFGFACHLKPGAQAPGLNANIPIYDYTAWNGAYTWNHNVQKWYFPALPINQSLWYDILADLVEQHIPVFEHLAQLLFGLDGVYVDIMTIPFAPPERAKTHIVYGRALAHTGWLSVMLFQHYEFTQNQTWLKHRAWPYIRRAADFYANYLQKYQQAEGDIYPSMLLEDAPHWKAGFPENRNVATDLIMFKKALSIAIQASEILHLDPDKRQRWQQSLSKVPEIDYGWQNNQGWYAIYKDWRKVWPDFNEYLKHIRTSRWGCSGWPIFPGEYIQGDEKKGLAKAVRDVLRGTDLLNLPNKTRILGTFHGEANFLPFIRAGLTEKYQDLRTLLLSHRFNSGQFSPFSTGQDVYIRKANFASWRIVENQYFPILGISEMLLQSQGHIIRLFPFWPKNQYASFKNLRARGGFEVSAQWSPKKGLNATIKSLCANPCRIRWDKETKPEILHNHKPVPYQIQDTDIVFDTKPQAVYVIKGP